MSIKKKLLASTLSFAYGVTAVMPVLAADTEIYLQTVTATASSSPTLMIALDTSGNMTLCVNSDASCLGSQQVGGSSRMGQMKLALMEVLDGTPDHVKLGLVKYIGANDNLSGEGFSANVQYPARPLGQRLSEGTINTQTSTTLVSTATDDLEWNKSTGTVVTSTGAVVDKLELGSTTNNVSFHFDSLGISNGADIQSAFIDAVVVQGASSVPTLKVWLYEEDSAAEFCPEGTSLDSTTCTPKRNTLVEISSAVTPTLTTTGNGNNAMTTMRLDVSRAIKTVVNRANWRRGNAVALMIQGTSSATFVAQGGNQPAEFAIKSRNAGGNISLQVVALTDARRMTVRDELKAWISGVTAEANDNSTGPLAYLEMGRYMMGASVEGPTSVTHSDAFNASTNRFISPLVDASQSCKADYMVLMSSGEPNNASGVDQNGAYLKAGGGTARACGLGTALTNPKPGWQCMFDVARWASENHSGSYDKTVRTSTVIFRPAIHKDGPLDKDMKKLSTTYGGGEHYYATNAADLAASFRDVINRLLSQGASMVAPGVAVNQLNRSEHLDQLYYGVFKPTNTSRWLGNLKRYRLQQMAEGDADILGQDRLTAVDPVTGYFSDRAYSFWSSAVDGNKAYEGGASSKINLPRKVFYGETVRDGDTALPLMMTFPESVDATSPDLVAGAEIDSGLTSYDANDIRWIVGIDVDDEDGDNLVTDARLSMGAPLHGQPTLLSYSATDMVAFVSTNDGLLHSIDTDTGVENWAWMPSALLSNIAALREDADSTTGPIYGLDSTWTVYSSGGRHMLAAGMGDGGRNYYGLNVTTKSTPRVAWSIIGGSTPGFSRLGNTWSQPLHLRVRVRAGGSSSSSIKDVLVFGGGYDSRYEDAAYITPSDSNDLGNAVYMVDAVTGELIWSATAGSGTNVTNVPDMRFSVTGRIRALDKNADGLADHLYFADLGGQVFRVDLNNATTAPSLVRRVQTIAKLGITESATSATAANKRHFFDAPGVAYVTEHVLNPVTGVTEEKILVAIAIGSGYRSHPLDVPAVGAQNPDRFFLIKDYDAARFDILTPDNEDGTSAVTLDAMVTSPNLADVSSLTGAAADTALVGMRGWYFSLPERGEKVLSSPLIYQGQIFFNTFVPSPANSVTCTPVQGKTFPWSVSVANAMPAQDYNADGSISSDDRRSDGPPLTGIAGDPGIIITRDENGNRVACSLSGTSCEEAADPPADLGKIMRTRWYDKK